MQLTVVGTGYQVASHLTLESRSAIEEADKVFYLVNDQLSEAYLQQLNATAESLASSYVEGRDGAVCSEEMVQRILKALDEGKNVCAAFSGHPAVFVAPALDAVRCARERGHQASLHPAVSIMGCLFSEIGVDPGVSGCSVFEATDFLLYGRQFDPTTPLVLLQIGVIGLTDYVARSPFCAERLAVLADVLMQTYSADHEVVVYETEVLPIGKPRLQRIPLAKLPEANVSVISTLYVPPRGTAIEDTAMRARISDYFPPEAEKL